VNSDATGNATGDSGDINITAKALSITDGSVMSASTLGQGNAGNVNVNVSGLLTLAGINNAPENMSLSKIISVVDSGAVGNGGTITIKAGSLSVRDGARLSTEIYPASDNLPVGRGNGGDITIAAGSLSLTNGAILSSSTYGIGNAGKVSVQTDGDISLAGAGGIFSTVGSGAVGNGGTIDINSTTGSLKVTAGALLGTAVKAAETGVGSTPATPGGQGNAGNINIQVGGDITFDGVAQVNGETSVSGAYSYLETGTQGKAGDITIAARSLSLSNSAQLSSSTYGIGNAGKVSVQTDSDISLAGEASILSTVGYVGNGGTIDINSRAGSLKVTTGAQLDTFVRAAAGAVSSSTIPTPGGQGNAGNINIQVGKDVTFDGVGQVKVNGITPLSGAFSNVETGTRGNGGGITIAARSLSLANGAGLFSDTAGTGSAGSVNINARDGVSFDGAGSNGSSSGIYTQSSNMSGTIGKAGDITVNTAAFRLANGARVSSQTDSPGDGGKVTINAKTFEAANGGQVLSSTASSGKAGNIVLHITDSVTLSGSDPTYLQRLQQFGPGVLGGEGASSGLFANTENGSTGQGGTISIDPIKLTIANGAQVAVGSMGQGEAGNIFLQARAITLDHGFVSATAASVNGGNISVQALESLLLRHGSQISATAGTANGGGNGGNISIGNTALVIAFPTENSDISANAFKGNGGQVQIHAAGIFGIQPQPASTPLSAITASSTGGGIKGVVNLNTLDVDPSRGLVALPVILADTSKQIAQGCAAGNGTTGSRFVVTGRGGLPSNPGEPLSSEAVWSDTRFVAVTGKSQHSQNVSAPQPSASAAAAIVPATGWVFNGKGDVTLTASVPSERLQVPWLTPASCQAR
jgi:large exoprotein involved in heme utilization and adhesion